MPRSGFLVKNILIIGDSQGRNGEFLNSAHLSNVYENQHILVNNDFTHDLKRVDRILKQIQSIAECAKNNAKPDRLTRAITDEFSFYTQNTPLSLEEYKRIIHGISTLLKEYPPNLVLILSSFSVIWPDGTLRNAVLHVQTPNDSASKVNIHHFSKEHFNPADPLYLNTNNMDRHYDVGADDYDHPEFSPDVVLRGTEVCCYDPMQHKSAIVVQGKNLPPIIDAIDICGDYHYGIAKQNVERLLSTMENPPLHISHIVTSNYLAELSDSMSVAGLVMSDYYNKSVAMVAEKKWFLFTQFLETIA